MVRLDKLRVSIEGVQVQPQDSFNSIFFTSHVVNLNCIFIPAVTTIYKFNLILPLPFRSKHCTGTSPEVNLRKTYRGNVVSLVCRYQKERIFVSYTTEPLQSFLPDGRRGLRYMTAHNELHIVHCRACFNQYIPNDVKGEK